MNVIFVHGWSVQHTDTYGDLPAWLQGQPGPGGTPFAVGNIHLGKYISFDDAVTVDDIARAFDQAIRDELAGKIQAGERFACITHSTGGPVVRKWMDLYYRDQIDQCPLSHLIMLAPANHGSALAQLGKSRLGRMKSALEGAECGQLVLNWLELGSEQSWELNTNWLDYDCVPEGVYPFVLTGQRIDRSFYDVLNSYTDEAGSDGVVRVAAANLNYGFLRLLQRNDGFSVDAMRRTVRTALGVLPGRSHSGDDMGIIRSVKLPNAATHPTAQWVLRCLQVSSRAAYNRLADDLDELTAATQEAERKERVKFLLGSRTYLTNRYSMIIFRLVDDRGQILSDYDLLLTAGPDYSENELPPGFFVDRQRNRINPGKLTYYVDHDVLEAGINHDRLAGKLGFRLLARPQQGLAFYRTLDFKSDFDTLAKVLRPNETMMVEIQLQRLVDATVFRLSNDLTPGKIDPTPSGQLVK